MQTQVAIQDTAAILEKVVIEGDLSTLSPVERVTYYRRVCETQGLNPFTKPFLYIVLNGKLKLYAARDCTDQLRKRDSISVSITSREVLEGIFVVTAEGRKPDGRTDTSIGAVPIENLKGEARANAMMKAETKAKRRVTLSICGLGWLDESETDSIPDATIVSVDTETGEIKETASQSSRSQQQPGRPPRQQARSAARTVEPPTSVVKQLQALAQKINMPDVALKEWLEDNGHMDGVMVRPSALPALEALVNAELEGRNSEEPKQ